VVQSPQWLRSDWKPLVSYSQPSPARPLQLAKPVLQLPTPQLPAEHKPVECSGAQLRPQPPQLFSSLANPELSYSQPLAYTWSQSVYPVLQLRIEHTPELQRGAPFSALQTVPQTPQLRMSRARSCWGL